jgi:hypothetical protein
MLDEWVDEVCAELGLDPDEVDLDEILDMARDVAHGIERRAAPVTAYLIGLAAGRAGETGSKATASVQSLLSRR